MRKHLRKSLGASGWGFVGGVVALGILCASARAQTPVEVEDFKLTASDAASSDQFGTSVSLSGDAALVGAPGDDGNSGAAYVLRFDGTNWTEEAKLIASDRAFGDQFGGAVSISGDVALIGASFDADAGTNAGSTYVFRFDGTTWVEEAKLIAAPVTFGDRFGVSVSVSGDVALIGAFGDDQQAFGAGAAYVFRFDGMTMTWVEEAKLLASDGGPSDIFGFSVSVCGDVALVGAQFDDVPGSNSGSAYVFRFDGMTMTWAQEAKLIPSDGATNDNFGNSVSISVDAALVGANLSSGAGLNSGSAYVFRFDGMTMTWAQEAKLTASDAASGDVFGFSVSISGDAAAVGARLEDTGASNSGAVYVFGFDGTSWVEEQKFIASDAASIDLFGSSVAISGDIVVGAPLRDAPPSAGAVYIFVGNVAPVADAVVEQLTDIGNQALVRLDGSGSFDSDDPTASLIFAWTVDGGTVCEGSALDCSTVETLVDFGVHEVTLRVTDPDGLFDEVTKAVTLDASNLSVLAIDRAKVKFSDDPPRIKLKGEIGLPFGVNFSEVVPLALVSVDLAGIDILPEPLTPIVFDVSGEDADEWEFDDPQAALNITKFNIDWKGTRFQFKQSGFPVRLKSQIITSSETVLTLTLKLKDLNGPLSIDIGGLATVDVDETGNITATVPFEIEKPRKKATLTLPFALLDTTVIAFSGSVNESILVGDHLKASIGRFRIDLDFSESLFPSGASTTPRTLDLALFVGDQGYFGASLLGPDDLKVKQNKWKTD